MHGVIVVGAGQAGLAVGLHLTRLGIEPVILERGRVGETWRTQRWDSFELNTPNWMNHLPGRPFEPTDPEGFASTDVLIRSFEEAAAGLEIRTGVAVERLAVDGSAYLLETTEGTLRSQTVVLAAGNLNVPRIPASVSTFPTSVLQLHTGDYRSPDRLPDGAVLVVGGGQSGAQIVEDLLRAGRSTYFSISAAPRIPRRYRGKDVMAWWDEMGIWDLTPDQIEDPKKLRATNPLISGVGPRGHSISYQSLSAAGATLLGRFERVEGAAVVTDGRAVEYLEHADAASDEMRAEIDDWIAEHAIDAPPPEDDPGDRPYGGEPIDLLTSVDLEAAGITTAIWATGFAGDFSWVDVPVLGDRGQIRHVNGVTDAPGLYCLGFGWTSNRRSGVIAGVDDDARRVAEAVRDHLGASA